MAAQDLGTLLALYIVIQHTWSKPKFATKTLIKIHFVFFEFETQAFTGQCKGLTNAFLKLYILDHYGLWTSKGSIITIDLEIPIENMEQTKL